MFFQAEIVVDYTEDVEYPLVHPATNLNVHELDPLGNYPCAGISFCSCHARDFFLAAMGSISLANLSRMAINFGPFGLAHYLDKFLDGLAINPPALTNPNRDNSAFFFNLSDEHDSRIASIGERPRVSASIGSQGLNWTKNY